MAVGLKIGAEEGISTKLHRHRRRAEVLVLLEGRFSSKLTESRGQLHELVHASLYMVVLGSRSL